MNAKEGGTEGGSPPRQVVVGLVFFFAFIGAFLSTLLLTAITGLPPNPRIGGDEGLLIRPEPVVIAVALAFGWPAILGTTAGVLAHNLLFRLVPGGVTLTFALAQTLVVLVATYLGYWARGRAPRPYNNLLATWIISGLLIILLGVVAALEYGTSVLVEWWHIFLEVFLPINIIGFLFLEAVDSRRRARLRVSAAEG